MFAMLVAAAIATTPVMMKSDSAAEIARALAPRENLRSMILMTVEHDNAGAEMARAVGAPRADALLAEAAEEMSFRYAEAWEANLANAYRTTLTSAELASALTAVRRSDRAALAPMSVRVGSAFFRNSADLLKKVSNEAVRLAKAEAERFGS